MNEMVEVTVMVTQDSAGHWWALSNDLPGLSVCRSSQDELTAAIPAAIKRLCRADGIPIQQVRKAPEKIKTLETTYAMKRSIGKAAAVAGAAQ